MSYDLILLCYDNSIVKVHLFTLSRRKDSTLIDNYYNTLINTILQSVNCTNFNGCPCAYCIMFLTMTVKAYCQIVSVSILTPL